MNNLDLDYQKLLRDILDTGVEKSDRTGTGTISVFGRQIRHKMSDGFPLLTTKKMAFKTMVVELLWFLRADTNIKYLLDNGCNIWNGDIYKKFLKTYEGRDGEIILPPDEYINDDGELLSHEEFIDKIKTDDVFAKEFGDLGPNYGFQWRKWGGRKDTKHTGYLHKTDNGWSIKWSDLHSFANGDEWLTTPIQDSDQSLYSDEDEGRKVYYENITLDYEKSFWPIQVAKVIDNKFDKYVGGIDQIQNLINDLKTNPDSRRLMVNAWNTSDLPHQVLPPCHFSFQVYTRELSLEERYNIWFNNNYETGMERFFDPNKLPNFDNPYFDSTPKRSISLIWNQRSVDTALGLPFNIASYGLLLTILGKIVNMIPDELIGNLGDTHIYKNQIDGVKEQLTREPFDLPSLRINTEFWPTESGECGIGPLTNNFDFLIKNINIDDFGLENYKSHPTIKMPLSN